MDVPTSELGGVGPGSPQQDLEGGGDMQSLGILTLTSTYQDLVMFSKCRRLFRSPSLPCSVIRPILKRLERPQDREGPVRSKRRKSVTPTEEELEPEEPVSMGCPPGAGRIGQAVWYKSHSGLICLMPQKARVLRSKSLCHDEIESLLDSDHRELIGDYSKVLLWGREAAATPQKPLCLIWPHLHLPSLQDGISPSLLGVTSEHRTGVTHKPKKEREKQTLGPEQ